MERAGRIMRHAFAEPRSTDEDGGRREYALNVILLGSIGTLAILELLASSSARWSVAYKGVSFAEFLALQSFFVLLYALSRYGRIAAASYLTAGAYFWGASYAAIQWGADWEMAIMGYALAIIVASVLLGTRWGFLTAAAAGGFAVVLWHAQWSGLVIAPKEQEPAASDALLFAILYFLLMLIAWLANRETERSLARARLSEAALRKERNLLEVRVEERTRDLRMSELAKIERLYQFAEFGRLSSGLFHDLLNVVNSVALESGRVVPRGARRKFSDALSANRQIEHFTQAIRRQLANEEIHESFSIAEIVEQAAGLLAYKANKAGVQIRFELDARDLLIWRGNPFKFHQIVMNLVANAIESYGAATVRHTRRDVIITAERRKKDFVLSVRDRGCGIAPSLHAKIFEPFFTTKGASRGMGIGLATTKRIVEKDLGGTIAVASVEGRETTFTVEFPVAPPVGIGPTSTP